VNIVFRADASVEIGSGHIMRCLTLADQLRANGAEIAFVCRDLPGSMFDLLQARGYRHARLPLVKSSDLFQPGDAEETRKAADAIFPKGLDWLVVDNYIIDIQWEKKMRPSAGRLMVIDDLADRHHDCDLLLDQNLYEDMDVRYNDLVPAECTKLTGPRYALLRPEFMEARRTLRERDGSVRHILVFFGGSDPTNETAKALRALLMLDLDMSLDVVVGSSNPHRQEVEKLCREYSKAFFVCQAENMAELMGRADLAIGGGGATTWERCIMKLPALVIALAENQIAIAEATDRAHAISYLGRTFEVGCAHLAHHIADAVSDPGRLRTMAERSGDLTDGNGCFRVIDHMR
jgi:UDP-2,4-diacetamido-2,4,6-trideoxy-beta-L-altropyranose hydrolase